jgi:hypothetical protein
MSKISFEMRSKMDGMSDVEFKEMMGLSKAAFLEYLDEAAAGESRCAARLGELAPDFSAHTLNGDGSISSDLFTLSELRGAPTSLIFGCYTCPIFRQQSDRMKQLIARYDAAIQFIFVYVLEAHPTDGWNTQSNMNANIMYTQPVNKDERAKVANDWRDAYGFESPIVLDWSDDRINQDYAGGPERLYVLDAEGMVTFKSEQGPYHDSHLDDWAAALELAAPLR